MSEYLLALIAGLGLLAFIVSPFVLLVLYVLRLLWVAAGSRDVNGEPERDAGA